MKIQFLYHEIIIKQKEYNDMKKTNIIFAKSFNNYLKEDKLHKKDLKIKNNNIDDNNRRITLIKKRIELKLNIK